MPVAICPRQCRTFQPDSLRNSAIGVPNSNAVCSRSFRIDSRRRMSIQLILPQYTARHPYPRLIPVQASLSAYSRRFRLDNRPQLLDQGCPCAKNIFSPSLKKIRVLGCVAVALGNLRFSRSAPFSRKHHRSSSGTSKLYWRHSRAAASEDSSTKLFKLVTGVEKVSLSARPAVG